MATRATGTFEVNLSPLPQDATPDQPQLGRMLIDKQFQGDLEARSAGQMLTAMTDIKSSAGYVAIERVTGVLNGLEGSFILQHSGTMAGGQQSLTITVVPDSGTDELMGISGMMDIIIEKGEHSYVFEYRFIG